MDPTVEPDRWLRQQLGEPEAGVAGDAPEAQASPDRLVRSVAQFLAVTHSHRAEGPDVSAEALLRVAEMRCREGRVDIDRIDMAYRSRSAEQLLDSARRLLPPPAEPAVVIGARSLGAFDLARDRVVGWRAGDPAMDVTWVARSIAATLGPAFVVAFAEAYGVGSPGPLRSEFWMTLGQLL